MGEGDGATVLALRWLFPALDGRLTVLERRPLVLGREGDVDVELPGEETSRRHAEVRLEGLLAQIRDLDSRNGVYVDGKRVKEAHLGIGSVVRLGEWVGVMVAVTRDEVVDHEPFQPILPGYFGGPVLRSTLAPLRKAAPSTLPVIVQGETGSGKEGVARAVHAWSGRPGPFLAVNCAALPEALAEGELFGYRRGAFTGAERANPGHLRAAHRDVARTRSSSIFSARSRSRCARSSSTRSSRSVSRRPCAWTSVVAAAQARCARPSRRSASAAISSRASTA